MTQKELDAVMEICSFIHSNKQGFFIDENSKPIDYESLTTWVRKQLSDSVGVYSIPMGSSWASLCTKEQMEKQLISFEKQL